MLLGLALEGEGWCTYMAWAAQWQARGMEVQAAAWADRVCCVSPANFKGEPNSYFRDENTCMSLEQIANPLWGGFQVRDLNVF